MPHPHGPETLQTNLSEVAVPHAPLPDPPARASSSRFASATPELTNAASNRSTWSRIGSSVASKEASCRQTFSIQTHTPRPMPWSTPKSVSLGYLFSQVIAAVTIKGKWADLEDVANKWSVRIETKREGPLSTRFPSTERYGSSRSVAIGSR